MGWKAEDSAKNPQASDRQSAALKNSYDWTLLPTIWDWENLKGNMRPEFQVQLS